MTTRTEYVKPIHPANAPKLAGNRSYMHLEPVTRRQLLVIRRRRKRYHTAHHQEVPQPPAL